MERNLRKGRELHARTHMGFQAGIVGKPNVGKSTFFAAATLQEVKIAPYPFTTVDPNVGMGYVRIKCVCRELGVEDNPRNSLCIEGNRFIPVELVDVAGLVPEAWKGRGLGNRFLDHIRRADVLIHVVDASGSTDEEGRPVKPGSHHPIDDVRFLEKELDMWIYQILSRDWDRVARKAKTIGQPTHIALSERLSGLKVTAEKALKALEKAGLEDKDPTRWGEDELMDISREIRRVTKPMVIAANKIDVEPAEDFVRDLEDELKGEYIVVPVSAEAELALRRASQKGWVKYVPGDSSFEITANLDERRLRALTIIREKVFEKWGGTGVQDAVNKAFLDLLGLIAVFPVEDERKLTDHHGNVLPDVFLIPRGTRARELAFLIHTDLGEKFIGAIDARTGRRLSADTPLRHRMIVKILASR